MSKMKNIVLSMALALGFSTACADVDSPESRSANTDNGTPTDTEGSTEDGPDNSSDPDENPQDTNQKDSNPDETPTGSEETPTDTTDTCTLEKGVYEYCNKNKPCSCDNLCGKQLMESTSMIKYKPVGSMCLAECTIGKDECPYSWETCGKLKDSDPQAFCMPMGKVSGTWQARLFEAGVDFSDHEQVAANYFMSNPNISVDVGWWKPAPDFTKGLVTYVDPEGNGVKYYMLTLVPETTTEYGNTVDNWMFEVLVPEKDWKKGTLALKNDPAAFIVQPKLLRIVKPTVSMRTWLHGAVRTSSTFTIDDAGALCTNTSNTQSCAVASGSFDIDLFGLSGTLTEQ